MRKIFSLLATVAIAAFALSCEKEARNNSLDKDVTRFSAQAPQVKTTIEADPANAKDRIVKWAAGDAITIWYEGGSTSATAASAGTSTSFDALGLGSASEYFAAYPETAATGLDAGTLSVVVPDSQDGSFASANIAVAGTTAADKTFKFHNVTALVKFSVSGADFTKAVFRGAKSEALSGTLPVSFDGSYGIVPGTATGTSTEVEAAINGAGEYYISVLPVSFSAGFSLTLYKGTSAEKPVVVPMAYNLSRGSILNLGAMDDDSKKISNYFVTPSGAGKKTGYNWDNAMGTAELKAFLEQPVDGENQVDEEAFYKADILDGATFHMAEGDYYLAGAADKQVKVEFSGYSKQVAMTFRGGYPTGLTGTALTGRTTPAGTEAQPANCTAFTGNDEAGIFIFGNQTDITFEGITFKGGKFADANNAAVRAEAGASGNSTLTLSGCRVVDNSNSDENSGAGIALGKASASIESCYFGGNSAKNASCININSGDGTVVVTDCLFKGNTTANTSGCIQNQSTKTVTITACTFEGNSAGSYGGGAFHINAEGAKTSMTGCTFTGNTAAKGGAISIQVGEVTLTNCTFTGNSATNGSNTNALETDSNVLKAFAGGAIILHSASSVCTLNACTFTDNSAPNGSGGAIAYENVAATLNINAGTTFSGNTAYNLGGAIYVRGAGKLNINGTNASKVTFTGDHTLATGNGHANGGAIWLGASSQTTMEYAKFDGCEAGQESGSTVNYSNGGAISMRAVDTFSAGNCVFTACRGRNGNALNIDQGTESSLLFSNCTFSDNIGRSGASKDGTVGNFHGGAARIGSGTARFESCSFTGNCAYNGSGVFHINKGASTDGRVEAENCTFSKNKAINGNGGVITIEYGSFQAKSCTFSENEAKNSSGTQYGGVLRADGKDDANNYVTFEDCIFSKNYAKQGGVLNVNKKNLTKINNCLFSENSADSRGMIQMANGVVYINNTTFYKNSTSGNNGWGVSIHGGAAALCMNNVTVFGNTNASTTAGNNNCAVNGAKALLITNCTVIESNQLALLRSDGAGPITMCNNILVNTASGKEIFAVANDGGTIVSRGHNAMGSTSESKYSNPGSDLVGCSASTFGGSYNTASNAYVWGGALSGFTAAVQSDVETAMQSHFNINVSDLSISNVGQDFYNWLDGLSPEGYKVDGRNVERTGTWWPGAYQQN